MTRAQRLILSAALAALIALIVLSVAGAFMGAGRAAAMFNSPVMIVFWILLAWLFMCGLVFFPRAMLRPGFVGMHVGCLLVLLGGMLGSQTGHTLLARRLGIAKVRSGSMVLAPGERTDSVTVDDQDQRYDLALPFEVALEQAWVEHYRPAGLALNEGMEWQPILWMFGTRYELGKTGIALHVLQYLDSARAVPGPGMLHIRDANGRQIDLPAEPARQAALDNPPLTVRVENVFANLQPHRQSPQTSTRPQTASRPSIAEAFEQELIPGRPRNAALELSFTTADGQETRTLVFYRPRLHGRVPPGVEVEYDFPEPATAVADASTHAPAMEVDLAVGEDIHWRVWLVADPAWPQPTLSLWPLMDLNVRMGSTPPAGLLEAKKPLLALMQPSGAVKAYKSRVAIYQDGRKAAEKTLAVNDPLHYGGYDLSLFSYHSAADGMYVVLAVHSDTGLWLVYAGFALLAAGMVWQFYVGPVVRWVSKKEHKDHKDHEEHEGEKA